MTRARAITGRATVHLPWAGGGGGVTIPVSARDVTLEFSIDVVIVRVGRVGISTTFLSSFSPFEIDEAARLTQVIVDRAPPA
jgi:hypothetical protein